MDNVESISKYFILFQEFTGGQVIFWSKASLWGVGFLKKK